MDEETKAFFDEVIAKLAPSLTHTGREALMPLIGHMFNHPWTDDNLRASMCENIANDFQIDRDLIPAELAELIE